MSKMQFCKSLGGKKNYENKDIGKFLFWYTIGNIRTSHIPLFKKISVTGQILANNDAGPFMRPFFMKFYSQIIILFTRWNTPVQGQGQKGSGSLVGILVVYLCQPNENIGWFLSNFGPMFISYK